ncbi:site-2 protease family protein [Enterococcus plantarum]|uniref:site-2 protease family protein n=1 Tax=Enterococcus plantarum TaxID=1077675 RepID=UPI001A900E76|nr:site-2 protease family protein [Enterococcus plantarum]MBO0423145.1 site-2 protease family protein [Enterococcus plantarum]
MNKKKIVIPTLIIVFLILEIIFPSVRNVSFYLFMLMLATFFALFFHEFGHVLGCRVTKTKITKFVVLCFSLELSNQGYKLRLNRNFAWFGGMVQFSVGNDDDIDGIYQKGAIIALAGPLASIIFCFISFIFSKMTPNLFFDSLSVMNLGVFGVTILPYYSSGVHSDGYQFLKLVKKDNYFQVIYLLSSYLSSNVEPKKWPEISWSAIQKIIDNNDIGERLILASYAFYRSQFVDIDDQSSSLIFDETLDLEKMKGTDTSKQLYRAYCQSYYYIENPHVQSNDFFIDKLDLISKARVNYFTALTTEEKNKYLKEYDMILSKNKDETMGFWIGEKQFNRKLHQLGKV